MSVDFIVELPDAQGFDMVMVVVDSVLKQAHFLATTMIISAEGAARLYYHDVWKLHGLPLKWVHDWGSIFILDFMRELNRLLRIETTRRLTDKPNTSTRNSRPTSGCSAITIRTTGTISSLQPSSPLQTTSMLQGK